MNMTSIVKALRERPVVQGINIMYPVASIIERIGPDWDWVWIDGQHGQLGYDNTIACVRACDLIGVPAVIRVASHDYGQIGLALDMGASGVMVPMVETADQAKAIVRAAKFPPEGSRSYGSRRMIDLYGRKYADNLNRNSLLIAQIENEEGLSNAERIAAVPGIDALFFGPDDMAMQMGLDMDKPRNPHLFYNHMKILFDAVDKAGKIAGTVAASPEILKIVLDIGYRLIVVTSEVGLLASSSKKVREEMDGVIATFGAAQ